MNKLYYGDCLTVMQEMKSNSVDLIYLDPPFNSNRQYNSIYKDETGRPLPDQIDAFCDMWELDTETERAYRTMPVLMREQGIDDATVEFWRLWMNALRNTQPRLLAYLTYMVQRLLQMRIILKDTGSVYLHCDQTASHYIKVMMDAIFGHQNFRNEVIWAYRTGGPSKRSFAKKHDTILFYSKTNNYVFNTQKEQSYTKSKNRRPGIGGGKARFYEDERGVFNWVNMRDVWNISYIGSTSKERMGYAAQKPLALLERIIQASTNEGDLVLDPFAGCATTLEAAHRLERRWIGVDIAIHAVKRVARQRLVDRLGLLEDKDFVIDGVPRNVEGARDLWERDKYHLQKWAVEQSDGFVTAKRTADGGIDGRIYFEMPGPYAGDSHLESMVLEVKGGKSVNIGMVRALRGVLEQDNALMAGLIVLEDLSPRQRGSFERVMAEAGDLEVHGIPYPRMQLLTVRELQDDRRFKTPTVHGRREYEPVLPGTNV